MDPQVLFIVDINKNILVFLHFFNEEININQKELPIILGKIASQSATLDVNSVHEIQINKKEFIFGNFKNLLIVLQYQKNDTPPYQLIVEINESFIKQFGFSLKSYSEKDILKFKSFNHSLKKILFKYPKYIFKKLDEIGSKPIIDPIKRDFFPQKLSIYKRDEIVWREIILIKELYPTEYIDGLIFRIFIFISISQNNCYKIFIDFSEYPSKPIIKIDNHLKDDLKRDLDQILYFYRTWDISNPSHIVEIINELYAVLWQYFIQKKLSKTSDLSLSVIPKLEPLQDID